MAILCTVVKGVDLPMFHPQTDPELASLLAQMALEPIDWDDLPRQRRINNARVLEQLQRGAAPVGVSIENRQVPGTNNTPPVPLRIYRPALGSGVLPGVYVIHGGGLVLGNLDSLELDCRRWTLEWNAVVVSVDYRLAPETPYPGPVQDCFQGLHWMVDHADELLIDSRRMAMYGTSAGGGLAAATALMVRDYGGPRLRLIMLNAPMLDDRNSSPSALNFADAPIWTRSDNLLGWQAYLGALWGSDVIVPYAVPGRAYNLQDLPPVFVTVGNIEVFRDECVAFAERLMHDGTNVELHVWPGVFHGAEQFTQAAIVKRMEAERNAAMIRALYG